MMPEAKLQHVVGATLVPTPLEEIAVYVHVPFCSSRCNYCDFYFETTRSPAVIGATLERIVEEAAYFSGAMSSPRVRSLYIGGGTPSVVPPAMLDRFLSRLDAALDCGESGGPGASATETTRRLSAPRDPRGTPEAIERTFEANPESVTPELLEVLGAHGINRLSLGVQTFHDPLLRALTRRADRATITAALETIGAARGAFRLNVDLITGIPGQTRRMVFEDIETALGSAVDHFSVYSLTVEEHTPLAQAVRRGVRRMPAVEDQESLWLAARERITSRGFDWYEISNFALPGCRSMHNLGYWRLEPYLGLGPGAVSTLPMAAPEAARARDVAARVVRLTNPNLFLYSSRLDPRPRYDVEEIDGQALLFEHFMTGLRTSEGVSLDRLRAVFGVDLAERWRDALARWRSQGLIDGRALGGEEPTLILAPAARLALDRHLLEIRGWIDELGALSAATWPDARVKEP